jgi:hypothetical protein
MTDISVFRDRDGPATWVVEDNDAYGESAVSWITFEGYQAELSARLTWKYWRRCRHRAKRIGRA